jgi:uncharacterized membrane protein YkoI
MSKSIFTSLFASSSLLLAIGCGSRGAPPPREENARQAPPTTAVSADAARKTALARVPGQVLDEELEEEDGRWVYEFDIRPTAAGTPEQEVVVDANNGQIVKVDAD